MAVYDRLHFALFNNQKFMLRLSDLPCVLLRLMKEILRFAHHDAWSSEQLKYILCKFHRRDSNRTPTAELIISDEFGYVYYTVHPESWHSRKPNSKWIVIFLFFLLDFDFFRWSIAFHVYLLFDFL